MQHDRYYIAGLISGISLQYREDTLEDRNFPDDGKWLDVNYTHGSRTLGSDASYHRLDVQTGKAWQKNKHHLIASGSIGSTFSDDTIITERFELGGFARLSGLEDGQLSGNHYLHGLGAYYYDFYSIPKIAELNAGLMFEAGNAWNNSGDVELGDMVLSASAFVGAKTIIGPAYMGVGVADGYDTRYFLQFGRAF